MTRKSSRKSNNELKRFASDVEWRDLHELIKTLPDNTEIVHVGLVFEDSYQVFAGRLPESQAVRFAFVRLRQASFLPELMRAPLQVRCILVVLAPSNNEVDYHEFGRGVSTLMSNLVRSFILST